ncbi:MAG: hypothetical protein K5867_02710 [Bacteroidales bacterium]|nr:hypothetical protein [Bacteroidales bacterium]
MKHKGLLIESLDSFIRKYYKNRLIRGILYASALLLSLFIVLVTAEYFGWFGRGVRTVVFWFFIAAIVVVAAVYVLLPLLRMHRLAGGLSYPDAARIAGAHFPEIQDKLLNLLQLQEMGGKADAATQELLQASIDQKSALLRVVPINKAINLKVNWKYVKYAAIPLLVILILLAVKPSFITAPTQRIVHHNAVYEKPAPFSFVVTNESLEAIQQEDFMLNVAVVGSSVPEEVYLNIDGYSYKMQNIDRTHFSYTVKNIQHTCDFNVSGGGVTSKIFTISVFNRPSVASFSVKLSYPAYTGKGAETLTNVGDIVVPEGTSLRWYFQLKHTDNLMFIIDSNATSFTPDKNGRLEIPHRAVRSFSYAFTVSNDAVNASDTMRYAVTTIPDGYPQIAVMEMRDSVYGEHLFFKGRIKDDYGFRKMDFVVVYGNKSNQELFDTLYYPIAVSRETEQDFSYSYNLNTLDISLGDQLFYFFQVWDNDEVHGSKSTKSRVFEFSVPSEEELKETISRNGADAQSQASLSIAEIKKLQQEIDEMVRKLVDKKELNWQDKQELKRLSDKQKDLQNKLEQMKNSIQQNNQLKEKYYEQSEQIIEKQRELEKMMENLMSEEMKKTLEEIDRLMQEADKKQVQEQLENLKMQNSDLEKQLDQNLELMKRLELESRVDNAKESAKKLSDEQRKLSEQTNEAKGKDNEQQKARQQELSNQFQQLKQDLKAIEQDYKKLEPSANFKLGEQTQQNIEQNQQNAQQQMNKGNNKSASKSQQQAADQLDSLAQQIEQEQERMEQEEMAEDSELIRRLLKNLVGISFNQEALISRVGETFIQDPRYQSIILDQNQIKDDFGQIEDSLRSIAKRQFAVASAINQNLGEVNTNIAKSLNTLLTYNQSFYGSSKNTGAAKWMQYSMTSVNNLALLLAESLDKMQDQQRQSKNSQCKNSSMMKSKSQCNNPGKNPSPKSMRKMQEELNKQLEALKKQLEKDGKPMGRRQIGEKNSMSEQLAKMAAQQEMIRRMMQEYGQRMKESDAGNTKLAKEIEQLQRQMEQTEQDIVNRTISQQTIQRQQQILTRLLEHEKAEMQREKDDRRQSREAKDIYEPSPKELESYEQLKQSNIDLFRRSVPTMNDYYKRKVTDYFYNF